MPISFCDEVDAAAIVVLDKLEWRDAFDTKADVSRLDEYISSVLDIRFTLIIEKNFMFQYCVNSMKPNDYGNGRKL